MNYSSTNYSDTFGCSDAKDCNLDCFRKKIVNMQGWFGEQRHGKPNDALCVNYLEHPATKQMQLNIFERESDGIAKFL